MLTKQQILSRERATGVRQIRLRRSYNKLLMGGGKKKSIERSIEKDYKLWKRNKEYVEKQRKEQQRRERIRKQRREQGKERHPADSPIIISGFMGIGKSTFAKKYPDTIDLESAGLNVFSDYVGAIWEAMTNYKYIFVSTHKSIRKWLFENRIPFILVYPSEDRKMEWVENLTKQAEERGERWERRIPGPARVLQSNWSTDMDLLRKDQFHTKKIIMKKPYYLSDYARHLNYNGTNFGRNKVTIHSPS